MVRVNCNGDNQCNQLFKEGPQLPRDHLWSWEGRGAKTHVKPDSFEKSVNLKLTLAMENVRTT